MNRTRRAGRLRSAFSLALTAVLAAGCARQGADSAADAQPVITIFDPSEGYPNGYFTVGDPDGLEVSGAFQLWVLETDEQQQPTGRRARLTNGTLAPPVLGKLREVPPLVIFEPRFSLRAGAWYEGVFTPRDGSERTVKKFRTPLNDSGPDTRVAAIYPSADALPENLLRFYVQFSGPMRRGSAYEHARLFDSGGAEVKGVFLAVEPELWDPEATRLTLLLDPGRIKRGLASLDEQGTNLREGASYTLRIDPAWRDASGSGLVEGFEKTFSVVAADRTSPDAEQWVVEAPRAGSRDSLRVAFDEPLDQALLERMLFVEDSQGRVVRGVPKPIDGERSWEWLPDEEWGTGAHVLIIDPLLEDRAGNGLNRLFDDVAGSSQDPSESEDLRLPFEVPPPVNAN